MQHPGISRPPYGNLPWRQMLHECAYKLLIFPRRENSDRRVNVLSKVRACVIQYSATSYEAKIMAIHIGPHIDRGSSCLVRLRGLGWPRLGL